MTFSSPRSLSELAAACSRSRRASGMTNSKTGSRGLTVREILCRPGSVVRRESCASSGPLADGRAKGRPQSALDTIIAAVAEANDCIVVTDNRNDFFDIKIVNPIRDGDGGRK